MEKHNFVNIQTLNREELLHLLEMAKEFEAHPNRELLKGKVVATLFYEPSTRTRRLPTDWVRASSALPTPRFRASARAKR